LRFVLNWFRCVVQSEPPVEFVAQEPCQPQTQVIVCSRCLYSSMTCRSGSGSPVRLAGRGKESGRPFQGGLLGTSGGSRGCGAGPNSIADSSTLCPTALTGPDPG